MLKQQVFNFEKDQGCRCNEVRRFVNFIHGGLDTPPRRPGKTKRSSSSSSSQILQTPQTQIRQRHVSPSAQRFEGLRTIRGHTPPQETPEGYQRVIDHWRTDKDGNTPPTILTKSLDPKVQRPYEQRELQKMKRVPFVGFKKKPPTPPPADFKTPPTM